VHFLINREFGLSQGALMLKATSMDCYTETHRDTNTDPQAETWTNRDTN